MPPAVQQGLLLRAAWHTDRDTRAPSINPQPRRRHASLNLLSRPAVAALVHALRSLTNIRQLCCVY